MSFHVRRITEGTLRQDRSCDRLATRVRRALGGLGVLAMLLALGPTAMAEVGRVTATHGFWDVKCGKPPGSKKEICWIEQKVTSEDRPSVGLTVTFFQSPGGKDRTLQVQAPLGIVLPRGLGLSVDGEDVGNVPFWRCFKAGCLARAEVPQTLYDRLRKGKTAIFIIFDTPEAGIGIPISLEGFSKALTSMN